MKSIPQLISVGDVLPEAWEKSLVLLKEQGISSRKESYTSESGVDKILEASMKIIIMRPLNEPMIHRGCEGLMALEEYVQEVLEGIKDEYIGKGWDYTYHQRLFKYTTTKEKRLDQINHIIETLSKASFSNRAQAVTWKVEQDTLAEGPPCLQRVWCKIIDDKYLELHTSWRSRDAYNASFMNMYAMIHLQKLIAKHLGVKVGQYVDDSDSYHVYDRNVHQFEKLLKTISLSRAQKRSSWADSSILKIFHEDLQ